MVVGTRVVGADVVGFAVVGAKVVDIGSTVGGEVGFCVGEKVVGPGVGGCIG